MRTTSRLFLALAAALAGSLSACGSKDPAAGQTTETAAADVPTPSTTAPAAPPEAAATPAASAAFDLSTVPVSSANLGQFPYLNKMHGYKFNVPSDSVGYSFERSYVYDGTNLVPVEGKVVRRAYLATDDKTKASDLMISRNYEDLIKGLGGVKVSSGKVSDAVVEKLGRDEFDKHRGNLETSKEVDTYVIRQANKEVWVQVMPYIEGKYYQLNVTERAAMPQQATIMKADELKKN